VIFFGKEGGNIEMRPERKYAEPVFGGALERKACTTHGWVREIFRETGREKISDKWSEGGPGLQSCAK
jgi:hypothetical protein